MSVNIPGVISIIIFYVLILAVGIWAGKKKGKGGEDGSESEDVMLAGRSIGLFVGVFTMTATWVGGGYINGTAESLYTTGLIGCQAPIGYALSLVIGGIFFATKMRQQGYVTMLDPFQDTLGDRMGGLLFLPALCGELFWSAAILSALGATLSVIIEIENSTAVILSACIAIFYTFFGGLYAVAYTDVIQLFCIFIGLWICIPFAIVNPAVKTLDPGVTNWIGTLTFRGSGAYLDTFLLLIFGGVPWQVYFQRVLSSKTAYRAQILSYVAAGGCVIMAIPPVIIGVIAKGTVWNETTYNKDAPADTTMILPLVLQHLTPVAVSFFGLGAVSAAVMSSADSSVLSASSMFARNIYKLMIRQNASEKEVIYVMRGGVIVVGVLATCLALTIHSIYGLWYLSSDLVYVILFPQLVCVVHFNKYCNTYGSLFAYIIGLLLRALGGESILRLPAVIHYPWYDKVDGQLFPFRTFAMLMSFASLLGVSAFSKWIFTNGHLPPSYDIFRCVVNIADDRIRMQEPAEGEMSILNTSSVPTYTETGGRENPALAVTPEPQEYKANDYMKIENKNFINDVHINNKEGIAQSRL
ncbi:Uncharacterised protein r2_g4077 [Pycnogonum litorale]